MRVACICSSSNDSVYRFLDSIPKLSNFKVLTFPSENPQVAAIIDKTAKPSVEYALSHNGTFVILDGKIYNKSELCRTTNIQVTGNDAQTILNLYWKSGQKFISQIDATASIVIWDASAEKLLIFRDRWGAVPSFYAKQGNSIVWAWHISTLLNLGVSPDINLNALDLFLGNGSIPAPWSFVERIKKIPPAHALTIHTNGFHDVTRYWQPTGLPKLTTDRDKTTKNLGELFKQSLLRRWSSNAKTGVLLSSGVDSKMIVAGLRTWFDASVDTFTFQYTDYDSPMNEVDEARRTARYFGMPHHEIRVRPTDIIDNLDWILRSYGEPLTFGIHSFMLRDIVKVGISEVMTGATADTCYPSKRDLEVLSYGQLPSSIQKLVQKTIPFLWQINSRTKPLWLWRMYKLAGEFAWQTEDLIEFARSGLPVNLNGHIVRKKYRGSFFRDTNWISEAHQKQEELFNSVLQDYKNESSKDKISCLILNLRTAEGLLYWSHWWGRAYGLNMHFPYLDRDFFEYLMRLPRKGRNKDEIRLLASNLMPDDMAYVPKISQGVPMNSWLRGPLKDFLHDQLSPKRVKESGLFDNTIVPKLIEEHISCKKDNQWKLWAILTVLTWQSLVAKHKL